MKKNYIVAPKYGAPDCYHSSHNTEKEALAAAEKLATNDGYAVCVFKKIATASPLPLRVKWDKPFQRVLVTGIPKRRKRK